MYPQDLLPRSHENFQNLLLSCNGSLAIIASPSPQYSEEKGSGDEEPGPLYRLPSSPAPFSPSTGRRGSGSFRVMAFVFADAPLLPRQSTSNSANLCNSRIFCRDPMRTSKTFCLVATGLSRSLPPLLLRTLRRRGRGMRSQAHYQTPLIPAPFSPSTGRRGVAGVLGLWLLYSLMLHYRPGNQLPTRQTYVPPGSSAEIP